MCEFAQDIDQLIGPEMVKTRPVVVVGVEKGGNARLVTVVPVSMTAPEPILDHHVEINERYLPEALQSRAGSRWAKCDMICTVGIGRLSVAQSRRVAGRRVSQLTQVPPAVGVQIRLALAKVLNIHPGLFQSLRAQADCAEVADLQIEVAAVTPSYTR